MMVRKNRKHVTEFWIRLRNAVSKPRLLPRRWFQTEQHVTPARRRFWAHLPLTNRRMCKLSSESLTFPGYFTLGIRSGAICALLILEIQSFKGILIHCSSWRENDKYFRCWLALKPVMWVICKVLSALMIHFLYFNKRVFLFSYTN